MNDPISLPQNCEKVFFKVLYFQHGFALGKKQTLNQKNSLTQDDLFKRLGSLKLYNWSLSKEFPIFASSFDNYLYIWSRKRTKMTSQ